MDPANRFGADTLEAEWNSKLRALNEVQREYQRLRRTDALAIDEARRARIAALASDFPRLWQDPKHLIAKRKSLSLPLPLSAPFLRNTPAVVVREFDCLLDQHTKTEIAAILNEKPSVQRSTNSSDKILITQASSTGGVLQSVGYSQYGGVPEIQLLATVDGVIANEFPVYVNAPRVQSQVGPYQYGCHEDKCEYPNGCLGRITNSITDLIGETLPPIDARETFENKRPIYPNENWTGSRLRLDWKQLL